MSGVLIVLFVLVAGAVVAFINTDSAPTNTGAFSSSCQTFNGGNESSCQAAGKTSFFSQVHGASFTGFGSDAPSIVNLLWALGMGLVLTAGVLLVVVAFIPTLGN